MLFTSYGFIFFLCVVIGLYYIIPKQFQWKLLLVSSFVFYYFSGWSNLIYISVTIVSTYFVGLKLDSLDRQQNLYLKENKEVLSREDKKAYKEKIKARRWRWLLLCLFFNLGILAVIKYTNFVIANINSIFTLFKLNELSFVNLCCQWVSHFIPSRPWGISLMYTEASMGLRKYR